MLQFCTFFIQIVHLLRSNLPLFLVRGWQHWYQVCTYHVRVFLFCFLYSNSCIFLTGRVIQWHVLKYIIIIMAVGHDSGVWWSSSSSNRLGPRRFSCWLSVLSHFVFSRPQPCDYDLVVVFKSGVIYLSARWVGGPGEGVGGEKRGQPNLNARTKRFVYNRPRSQISIGPEASRSKYQ